MTLKLQKATLLMIFVGSIAYAEGGHHSEGVPKVVYWQALNLVILFSVLIYFVSGTIKKLFNDRYEMFLESAKKSKLAEEKAQRELIDIKHKIDMLSSGREESLARARAEAADHKNNLIQEAKSTASRIRKEGQEMAQLEAQRAFFNLKQSAVQESINQSRKVLTTDIGAQDHQKLQNEFSKNIAGVHP